MITKLNEKLKELKLYTTEWASNGTSSLIICDQDGRIILCLDEALFNAPQKNHLETFDQEYLCDGESVFLSHQGDHFDPLYSISPETALRCIAVSPVQTEKSVLNKINKAIKGA